jgi:hypothetical protein
MRILIFICFIFSFLTSFGQNVLELQNTQSGKTRILKSGTKIQFKTIDDSVFVKGNISQIKDGSIVIYCPDFSEESPLVDLTVNDIKEIKKATTFHSISRSLAKVLLPVGTFFFANGIITLAKDSEYQGVKQYDEDKTKSLTTAGGVLMVAGVIPFLFNQKVYDLKKDWTLSIKKLDK